MATQYLSSQVVVVELEPQIPAISALPSAVLLCEGITERGPINDPRLVLSFSEYEEIFGGFTTDADVALAIHGFFLGRGQSAYVNRIVHYTDLTDVTAHTAVKGSVTLQNNGSAATAAILGPGSVSAPFNMSSGDNFDLSIDGGGTVSSTFTGTQASLTDTATYPVGALAGTETMGITVDGVEGGSEQTVTAAGGETTALQIAALINDQVKGVNATVSGGQVVVTTDQGGTGAGIQVTTGGTLNAVLGFPTSKSSGTGNVSDIDAVTTSEVETIIEAALSGDVAVTFNGSNQVIISTTDTGVAATIQQPGTSSFTFGLDTSLHTGTDASPENTLTVDGKTHGSYTDDITIKIEDATSTTASEFNLKVIRSGVVKETWTNLTMDDTLTNYVETVINDEVSGSLYIAVTDLDVVGSVTVQRPANGTSAAMSGGDDGLTSLADADYIGSEAGKTGLYAFDAVSDGRILVLPGVTSAAVHLAMLTYAASTREGSMFAILDSPSGYTKAQIVSHVDSNGILENANGEYGAIYWPWIKVSNPQPSVFGTDASITVPPSAWIAGKYARNDQLNGGVYESPAGVGIGAGANGVIDGMTGLEDDPAGSDRHPVLDKNVRDFIYPKRINPIVKTDGQPFHIDGGRTLRSTGNFPNIGERRGVIFIAESLKAGLVVFKHRPNNRKNRQRAQRTIQVFLEQEMAKGAFRSEDPNTAFFVDVSDQLNPPANEFAGLLTARIGLATNKPAEFIVLQITQDTRGLTE